MFTWRHLCYRTVFKRKKVKANCIIYCFAHRVFYGDSKNFFYRFKFFHVWTNQSLSEDYFFSCSWEKLSAGSNWLKLCIWRIPCTKTKRDTECMADWTASSCPQKMNVPAQFLNWVACRTGRFAGQSAKRETRNTGAERKLGHVSETKSI